MTFGEETELLARSGETDMVLARCRVLARQSDTSGLLISLLDARDGKMLTPRQFRRIWRLASGAAEPEKTRLMNRLAEARPRSPLLPRTGAARPLLVTTAAGTVYCDPEAAGAVRTGDMLLLVRERDNPHDALAVRLDTWDGRKVGYVPRAVNAPVAGLLDAGVGLECAVTAVESGRNAPFITISVTEKM